MRFSANRCFWFFALFVFIFASPGYSAEGKGPQGQKPTDDTTGPRIALTNAPGGTLSGTYRGKKFSKMVVANGPLTLIDCELPGFKATDGPAVLSHCDINGWVGIVPTNIDPDKPILTMSFCKIVGPEANDSVRLGGAAGWGRNSPYLNVTIEDSIIHSPYNPAINPKAHFDLIQWGGGANTTFNRVVFSFKKQKYHFSMVNYLNNGVKSPNIVCKNVWFEGGPVSYVFAGPLTIINGLIERSTKKYGYVYPKSQVTFINCMDDTGADISNSK